MGFKKIATIPIDRIDQRTLAYDPREEDVFAAMADGIPKILCTLTPREEKILRMHYGIGGAGGTRPPTDIPIRKLRNPPRRKLLRRVA